ncbi:MAG: WxL protein peptidoglycan domain-containing protein [Angustibacter sp.]
MATTPLGTSPPRLSLALTAATVVVLATQPPAGAGALGGSASMAVVSRSAPAAESTTPGTRSGSGQPITWGVAPAGKGERAGRAAFAHRLDPGRSVSDVVRVSNYSTSPLRLRVYPQDAVNTRQGGYDLLSVDEAPRGVGAWVRLTRRTITVPARADVDVPFRIEMPPKATPGDHAGGVVAALVGPGRDEQGREVLVERRVGARVYLRVPGAVRTELSVQALSGRYDESLNPVGPGAVPLSYDVRNTGNVRLSAQPWARVSDPTGRVVRVVSGPVVREVLPGQTVTVVLRVPRVWPLGRLQVRVGARPGPAPAAEVIGGGTRPAPAAERTATRDLWAMPWATLAVLALLVVLTTAWWRRRRQAVAEPAPPPAPPGPSATGSAPGGQAPGGPAVAAVGSSMRVTAATATAATATAGRAAR